ncbi:hypothetical protein MBLNU459_g1515t1 [Dothideomycetes sp. NU459]
MESVVSFDYAEWLRQQQVEKAPSTVATESEAGVEEDDEDNVYEYQPMREPEQPYTLQPALAYYPAQYTYAQPQQLQIAQSSPRPAATQQPLVIAYPHGYAYPIQVAMPNYPVPVTEVKESAKESAKEKDKAKEKENEKKKATEHHRTWVGRTKKQVDEDNIQIAVNEGIYKPNDIVPKGAKDDQLFWCIETDGSNTLRTFRTIEDDLYPGRWKVDPRYGNLYFVREKEKKK